MNESIDWIPSLAGPPGKISCLGMDEFERSKPFSGLANRLQLFKQSIVTMTVTKKVSQHVLEPTSLSSVLQL